jgi:hypothetical protein
MAPATLMGWPQQLGGPAGLRFRPYHAARDSAEVLGPDPGRLAALKSEEAVLALRGEVTRKITRLNDLLELALAGRFDPNPYSRRIRMRR